MPLVLGVSLLLNAALAAQRPSSADDPALWQPTAPYVTAGQDEPGYRSWYLAVPSRSGSVKAFNDYLTTYGVGGIVPTWQLLRTASDWQKCGAQPFEIAPTDEWPNIVQTLRYIRDRVIPGLGPVEPVSVYRDPELNSCAGGAPESAHRDLQAVDLVPLRPITREALIRQLCTIHAATGEQYGVGLGFYPFLRFHIDSRKFRKWGVGSGPEAAACNAEPPAMVAAPSPASPTVPTPATSAPAADPPPVVAPSLSTPHL